MKKLIFLSALAAGALSVSAQTKMDQDRAAIKSLAGYYKVTFNYAETFATDTAYKFFPRYKSWGYEWATIVEDSPKKIAIQHLLVVGDSTIIKHWREDWVYEQPSMLTYEKDNTWKKVNFKPADVKGRWIQKVYQVDDSPRYEGIGTWTHVDGRHEWQSRTDSPLPRREYTKRNDYNVLNRGNRIYMTDKGWMFEQDNNKVLRNANGDKLIAQEKGYEEFTKVDEAKFAYAKKWWADQQAYWKDARVAWEEVFAKNPTLKLTDKIEGKRLYDRLFEVAETSAKEKWSGAKNKAETVKVINSYLKQS
ncbi:hypothetical protein FPZ43_07545 [Mucilaginibacter pallidiroseus]|uniref:Uncharacterized protein n=1 Tax=Mucilaginibacter pallidiroseus TaxID=2599295 RepID=A0A563UEB1_9SPHI|nr:DUF6607 family protein [Mucilaginibacter pallidiroseus]TWR29707.1 hypothetical protein FPZ43_07545 [Mucilaginibacter pallidiroseus]